MSTQQILLNVQIVVMVVGAVFSVACQVQPLNKEPVISQVEVMRSPGLMSQIEDHMPQPTSGRLEKGERLFNLLCTSCHAYVDTQGFLTEDSSLRVDQIGNAPSVNDMGNRSKRELTDSYLGATIQYGKNGAVSAHSMPAWENILKKTEIDNLVAFIKQFKR